MTVFIPIRTRVGGFGLRRSSRIVLPETDHRPVATARRHTRTTLGAWGLPGDVVDSAELVVSELVTNAQRYAPGPVALRLTLRRTGREGRELTVACRDTDPHPPPATGADAVDGPSCAQAESGRGLAIVEALCHHRGCAVARAHKTVWAALTVPAAPASPRPVPVARRGRGRALHLPARTRRPAPEQPGCAA